jgi:hypothetical protein
MHISCSKTSFSENRYVQVTIGKNVVEPDRPQVTENVVEPDRPQVTQNAVEPDRPQMTQN